jgi:hypothetical protein
MVFLVDVVSGCGLLCNGLQVFGTLLVIDGCFDESIEQGVAIPGS